jgi:hypothetical protein
MTVMCGFSQVNRGSAIIGPRLLEIVNPVLVLPAEIAEFGNICLTRPTACLWGSQFEPKAPASRVLIVRRLGSQPDDTGQ